MSFSRMLLLVLLASPLFAQEESGVAIAVVSGHSRRIWAPADNNAASSSTKRRDACEEWL